MYPDGGYLTGFSVLYWAVIELGFLAALQAVIGGFDSHTVHQIGAKVFMDAHNTVTVVERDRYPLAPPIKKAIMDWFEYTYNDFPEVIAKRNIGCSANKYWHPFVHKMLQTLLDAEVYPQIVQIKEKFGELRIYCDNSTEESRLIINEAIKACAGVCAECGSTEDVQRHSSENKMWVLPRCKACRT